MSRPPRCRYWKECGVFHGGCCVIGFYGGRPSYGSCHYCLQAGRQSRGFGDTVAKAIHVTTGGIVKPCGGCKKRQSVLNRVVPYRR